MIRPRRRFAQDRQSGWQASGAADRRYRLVSMLRARPLSASGHLWSVVVRVGLLSGSTAFPQGISVVRATQQRGGKGVRTPVHLYPPRWRTSAKKGGVALTISTPPVRRAAAPAGRGTREAQPPFSFPWRTREIRVIPRLMQRFGEVLNHNGEGSAL